jgi:NitT/TauT family transport system substrate-binding protein
MIKGRIAPAAFLSALLALVLVTAGCGTAPAASQSQAPLRAIKFAVAVAVPDPGQVFVYAPAGWNYFEAEGLKVEIVTNPGGGAALQQLATGKVDFALSSPENFYNGVAEGMTLRGFATAITHSIYSVGVLTDSPIRSYADVKGKKLGISAFTSGAYPIAQLAMAENRIDPKKDVQFVTIGTSGPAADALKTGKVDVVVTTDTQWAIFKTLGVNFRYLPDPSAAKLPADLLLARTETLQNEPDLAVRFARAVMKGTIAATANPSKAIDFYLKLFPDAAGGKSKEENQAIMQARLKNMQLLPEQKGKWGYIPIEGYQEVQKGGLEYKTVKKEQDLNVLLSNALINKINSFDPEKVKTEAKATK